MREKSDHDIAQGFQLFDQSRQIAERHLIWPIGQGLGWIFVGFQKDTIAARSHSGSRENGCQFAIAPGGLPCPAGALD
jgi:hypothetical protein